LPLLEFYWFTRGEALRIHDFTEEWYLICSTVIRCGRSLLLCSLHWMRNSNSLGNRMVLATLTEPLDLLLVDDEPDFLEPACRFFQRQGYRVVAAANAEQAISVQTNQHFHVAIIDQNMPGVNGLDLLTRLHRDDPDLKIVMLTGGGSIGSAVEAMKRGAIDYLSKPFGLDELDMLVRRLAKTVSLERENIHLKRQVANHNRPKPLIGNSPGIQEVKRLIGRIAPSDKPVLILGESGTGKELVARAIHAQSTLSDRPLVVINCAALPESLLESELFGYEKGAFTGAVDAKPGLFEIADGGTLFIDEFGELAGGLQAKLLRVLEDGTMRRIGATKERKVKVRLIAATNRNLGKEVADGRFREDLYYRVNVLSITIPPLRERIDDIPLLIHHWLGEDWKLGAGVMELFRSHPWPGNIRQLINALERAKILSDDHCINVENLPSEIQRSTGSQELSQALSDQPKVGDAIPLESLSQRHVTEVLKRNRGNKTRAAKELGIARRSLYRILDNLASKKEIAE
jgi:DNA-binding NtrC family response regulator